MNTVDESTSVRYGKIVCVTGQIPDIPQGKHPEQGTSSSQAVVLESTWWYRVYPGHGGEAEEHMANTTVSHI